MLMAGAQCLFIVILFAVVPPLLTLTTDFGLQDSYLGVMKGVIYSIAPDANIVDITHDIPPQQIMTAGFHLQVSHPYFPPDTIHVVVVDPGVGTSRKAVCIRSDNG